MNVIQRTFAILVGLALLTGLLPVATVGAQTTPVPNMGNPAFTRTWARTDYPLIDGKTKRTWYYGPEARLSCQEQYKESPGGTRQVTYLDKARLELNDPATGVVTGGHLAKELISGRFQMGDAEFKLYVPSEEPVAGDPNSTTSPTYKSFGSVTSVEPGQHRSDPRQGQTVTQTLNRVGQVGNDPSLARYGVTLVDYRSELGHNVPNVFMDFFNQRGIVAELAENGTVT